MGPPDGGLEGALGSRLDGPFALVALDRERERLTAVRDRFGMRPLYYRHDGESLTLASEIKQFFANQRATPRLEPVACLDFLIDGLTDHSRLTMFEGVHRLGAGERLDVDLHSLRGRDQLPAPSRWYDPPVPGSVQLSEEEASTRFRELLLDSVRLCWNGGRTNALCLSGGIDSATLACALSGLDPRREPITALKASFEDPRYDEPELLNGVARRVSTTLHSTPCAGLDALDQLPHLVWHLDEPYSRASLAAQWLLFRRAAELGVDATLDGQGADELLGGYASMVAEHRAFEGAANGGASAVAGESSRAGGPAAGGGAETFEWLAPEWRDRAVMRRAAEHPRAARSLGELCRHRLSHGDLPMMMRHNDRIGSAHGVETFVPYLDHRVVDLCIGLGDEHKLENGQTKYLMRRSFGDVLPPEVLASRTKGSYSELEAGWFRGAISDGLVEGARRTASAWPSIFDSNGVRALTRSPARASKETLMLCWRILAFGAWMDMFGVEP
jgi:asparagine synthase (glutamine-hydrolysing)